MSKIIIKTDIIKSIVFGKMLKDVKMSDFLEVFEFVFDEPIQIMSMPYFKPLLAFYVDRQYPLLHDVDSYEIEICKDVKHELFINFTNVAQFVSLGIDKYISYCTNDVWGNWICQLRGYGFSVTDEMLSDVDYTQDRIFQSLKYRIKLEQESENT